jgi:hypothetical protein
MPKKTTVTIVILASILLLIAGVFAFVINQREAIAAAMRERMANKEEL